MAKLFFESSDGTLWFKKLTLHASGIAWYNPEIERGCWFSGQIGNIVEDQNSILWLVTTFPESKLYSLKIKP